MGLMDKVKATAEKAAEMAQQGVNQGKEKLNDVQDRRKLDATLRDLGAAVYLDRAGRATPELATDVERLLAEVGEMEAAGTMVAPSAEPTGPDAAGTSDAAGPAGESAPAAMAEPMPEVAPVPTPEGSYKLE